MLALKILRRVSFTIFGISIIYLLSPHRYLGDFQDKIPIDWKFLAFWLVGLLITYINWDSKTNWQVLIQLIIVTLMIVLPLVLMVVASSGL